MNPSLKKLFRGILLLFIISCSSEETAEVNDKEAPSRSSIKSSSSETNPKKKFELASNGLEYKLIEKYEKDFANGDLSSVINGNVYKIDSTKKSRVFLESRLCTKEYSLSFFEYKHPTFLSSEMNNVLSPDTVLLTNTNINSELFESINANHFFKDSSFVNSGDLLLILSNTFHSHNAYFIHVWEISKGNGTFINQRKTFKFNAEGSIVDESFMNHSFNSNSRSQLFLERLF